MIDWRDFDARLTRRVSTASRECFEIVAEQARGVIRNVVNVTPPNHSLGDGRGLTSMSQGKAAGEARVAADIAKLYGTPSDAYDLIAAKSQDAADAFWSVKKSRPDAAADIVREQINVSYSPFDGGELHRRFRGKRGKVSRGRGATKPVYIVTDPAELAAYVKKKQANVFYLASGWKPICSKLGIPLPQMITRHSAPGVATVSITADHIRVYAGNDVSYAQAVDLQRRVQMAIDMQVGAMDRQWNRFVQNKFWRTAGFNMAA